MVEAQEKLNKFEMTRVLSARALELAEGDEAKVKLPKEMKNRTLTQDYVKIAQMEFDAGKLDLEIYK
jgi:DNA-directed RNA polymerase subunit K/omega